MTNPFDPGYYLSEELRRFGFKAVGENVAINRACNIIGPENIEIGDNVRIDAYTSIIAANGWLKMGSYIHVAIGCTLGCRGGIEIGDFCALSQGAKILSASDDFTGEHMASCMVPDQATGAKVERVEIGRHSVIGANSIVLPGCSIGEGCAVGSLSLVTRSLAPWGVYAGVPALHRRERLRNALDIEAGLIGDGARAA